MFYTIQQFILDDQLDFGAVDVDKNAGDHLQDEYQYDQHKVLEKRIASQLLNTFTQID